MKRPVPVYTILLLCIVALLLAWRFCGDKPKQPAPPAQPAAADGPPAAPSGLD